MAKLQLETLNCEFGFAKFLPSTLRTLNFSYHSLSASIVSICGSMKESAMQYVYPLQHLYPVSSR